MILTACIILGSFAAVGVRGLNLGVDFSSGTRFDVQLDQQVSAEKVRSTLVNLNSSYSTATIQQTHAAAGQKDRKGSSFSITVEKLKGGTSDAGGSKTEQAQSRQTSAENHVRDALDSRFGISKEGFNSQTIGPSFGKQVLNLAIIAVVVSLLLEVAYIAWRFEWLYALPVIVALVHDMALAAGAYALTGREFKSTTVAALLTILGYSLYDTVIVFDRIRENVHVLRKSSFQRIATTSLNEVLTRSLNTSFVVLLPTAALYFFGGETLQDFAFALLVGVASGVVSSITVATPLLCYLKEREPAWRKRLEVEEAATADRDAAAGPVSSNGAGADDSTNIGPARPARPTGR